MIVTNAILFSGSLAIGKGSSNNTVNDALPAPTGTWAAPISRFGSLLAAGNATLTIDAGTLAVCSHRDHWQRQSRLAQHQHAVGNSPSY